MNFGEEDARWRVCTQSMGQVELRVAPRGGEVRLRDVAEGRGKWQKRAGAAGQGSVEGGAGTADGPQFTQWLHCHSGCGLPHLH